MAMQDLDRILGAGDEAKVPDLDWLTVDVEDVKNIPRPMDVEMIPQLKDAWTHRSERSTSLVPNLEVKGKKASTEVSAELITAIVNTAKREMMAGLQGKELAVKLGSMYPQEVIRAAKDELVKVASEQGLLGNVYIDMSCFETCQDARRILGSNKIRLAKYVVGEPSRRTCRGHKNGYCDEMKRRVLPEMIYDQELLDEYASHLKVAGVLACDEKVESKDSLRDCMLRKRKKQAAFRPVTQKAVVERSSDQVSKDFSDALTKQATMDDKTAAALRLREARPVLAFIQDQMLKGRMGESLKEAIRKNFSSREIENFSPEIKKMASLQGLLGNVYVDLSYYKDADEAIRAIKKASTNPVYLVYTTRKGPNDNRLDKVASVTGCKELPKDGKIDPTIAKSYIEDLQFANRLSAEKAKELGESLESSENVLAVLRNAFLSSLEHKKKTREGGQPGYEYSGEAHKYASKDIKYRAAVEKAITAGISIHDVEDKLASQVSTPDAVSMTRSVLASIKEVDANALGKCMTEKYQLDRRATIKKASKCEDCIQCGDYGCLRLGVKFAGSKSKDKADFDLDAPTEKVQLKDNPDVSREDIGQEYDMGDSFGSGMNIALEEMRSKGATDAVELDLDFNQEGLDQNIADL